MFLKSNAPGRQLSAKKQTIPSIITRDINILGNIVSEGNIDFDGTLNGNVRCDTLTVRPHGVITGEVVANSVLVYGKIKGLIRGKSVQLFASCNVEGIIMHEAIAIEDGASVDGKFKRANKVKGPDENADGSSFFYEEEEGEEGEDGDAKLVESIRLIR